MTSMHKLAPGNESYTRFYKSCCNETCRQKFLVTEDIRQSYCCRACSSAQKERRKKAREKLRTDTFVAMAIDAMKNTNAVQKVCTPTKEEPTFVYNTFGEPIPTYISPKSFTERVEEIKQLVRWKNHVGPQFSERKATVTFEDASEELMVAFKKAVEADGMRCDFHGSGVITLEPPLHARQRMQLPVELTKVISIEVRVTTTNPSTDQIVAKVAREMELAFGDGAKIGRIETQVL